jgi:DivIVA domain-containing protein
MYAHPFLASHARAYIERLGGAPPPGAGWKGGSRSGPSGSRAEADCDLRITALPAQVEARSAWPGAAPTSTAGIGHTRAVVEDEPRQGGERNSEPSPGALEQGRDLAELALPVQVPAEIRNVSFPVAVRGYSRPAVDAYVERVNRVIAELEVGSSPRAAVRHALDRVTEQVAGILQEARESAEQITASAREEAEESSARAGAEAAELVVNASAEADRTKAEAEELLARTKAEADEVLAHSRREAEELLAQSRSEATERLERGEQELKAVQEQAEKRMRELEADTNVVREERHELVVDIRAMATRLDELASGAAARYPPEEPSTEPEEARQGSEGGAKPELAGVDTTKRLGRGGSSSA